MERRIAKESIPAPCATCQHCGLSFQPYRPTQTRCRECQYLARIEANKLRRREKARELGKAARPSQCLGCNAELGEDTKQHRCPTCWLAAKRLRNAEREARLRREHGAVAVGEHFPCARCGTPVVRASGSQRFCQPCRQQSKLEAHRIANQKYEADRPPRKRDPEETKARNRRYVERHPHKVLARSRRYNETNREEINRKSRERAMQPGYHERRREWDRRRSAKPKNRVDARMKASIREALQGGKAGRSWETLVGYTLDDLARHLERQFVKGMRWENIGEWEIDHIRPKALFVYSSAEDPEFRECWSLHNLRPLWSADNRSKHAKRIFLI